MNNKKSGFTLIEVLLVIGIIVILASAIILAVNPGRQFAKTRNAQRINDINAILNAIVQNMTDNQGRWNCPSSNNYSSQLPTQVTKILASGNESDNTFFNISCLVPNYLTKVPVDPSLAANSAITNYTLVYTPATGRITICAPSAELNETICLER